mmetsp:Transcript_11915/g.35662  ORF Transcript_11915/g.35662 Transcript_11915/m.35662 type:complete len:271 (+) Transcript_11915:3784-4596(+)
MTAATAAMPLQTPASPILQMALGSPRKPRGGRVIRHFRVEALAEELSAAEGPVMVEAGAQPKVKRKARAQAWAVLHPRVLTLTCWGSTAQTVPEAGAEARPSKRRQTFLKRRTCLKRWSYPNQGCPEHLEHSRAALAQPSSAATAMQTASRLQRRWRRRPCHSLRQTGCLHHRCRQTGCHRRFRTGKSAPAPTAARARCLRAMAARHIVPLQRRSRGRWALQTRHTWCHAYHVQSRATKTAPAEETPPRSVHRRASKATPAEEASLRSVQ